MFKGWPWRDYLQTGFLGRSFGWTFPNIIFCACLAEPRQRARCFLVFSEWHEFRVFFFFRITSLFSEVCVRQNFGNFQFWSHFPTTSFWSPFHIGSPFFHPTSVKSGGCSTPRQFQAQSIGNSTVPLRGSDQGKTCKMVIEMSWKSAGSSVDFF